MNRRYRHSTESHPERGAVLVLVAISMVALIGIVALAVDIGYLLVTRNEVQNVADGSALAATRELGAIYQDLSYTAQQTYHCGGDCQTRVKDVARDLAAKNRAGGRSILELEDVFIGRWSHGQFTETPDRPNAVRVIARRDEFENGPVATFFARVLGINEAPVNAEAVAAMTGQGTVVPGELAIPVALDHWFFELLPDEDRCNDYIQFYPSGEACAGWTTWDSKTASASQLNEILKGDYESPEMTAGEADIRMTSGLQASNLVHFLHLFQDQGCATTAHSDALQRRYLTRNGETSAELIDCVSWEEVLDEKYVSHRKPWLEDGVQTYYPERNPPYKDDLLAPRYYHMWDATVPIYENLGHPNECPPPNQTRKVVGFARVLITDVRLSSADTNKHQILGRVICNVVSPEANRGGGGEYGTFGPIPGLVR